MGVKSAVVAFLSRVCVVSLVIGGLAASEGCRSASSPSRGIVKAGVAALP